MSDDTGPALTVDEFVDYCHTQAGLLSGQVETMRDEASELLSEIDANMAELRGELEDRGNAVTGADAPSTPSGPGDLDIDALEELEAEVKEKQLLVEAKQTRMQVFQDLAGAYTDLAADLEADVDDGEEALSRVVRFEAEEDAPAYFDDRQTILEAATDSSSSERD